MEGEERKLSWLQPAPDQKFAIFVHSVCISSTDGVPRFSWYHLVLGTSMLVGYILLNNDTVFLTKEKKLKA